MIDKITIVIGIVYLIIGIIYGTILFEGSDEIIKNPRYVPFTVLYVLLAILYVYKGIYH